MDHIYKYNNCFKNNIVIAILFGFVWTSVLKANAYYYNGDQRVQIIQERGILAEKVNLVGNNFQTESSLVKRVDRNSELIKQQGGMVFWRTNPIHTKSRITQRFQVRDANSKYLPVYRNVSGAMMVPTGNMMVYFIVGFSESQVKSWALGRGLRVLEKLPLQLKNVWVIETPPGEKAIEIANSVIGDGQVETAMPNFWVEFSKK